jgi:hypothetical protein
MAVAVAMATMAGGCELQVAGRGPIPIYAAVAPPPPPAHGRSAPQGAPPPQAGRPPAAGPAPYTPLACIDPGERDLSDRYDQAMVIGPRSTTVACSFRGDVDAFVATAPPGAAGSIIHVSVRGETKLVPALQIKNANRTNVVYLVGNEGGVRGWVHVAGGTSIFLFVTQEGDEREAYQLTLTVEAVSEPSEPNNDMEHATPLRPGQPATGFFGWAANDPALGDDWYRVESAHDGPLKVDLDTSEGVYPMIKIFDANRRELTRSTGGAGERIQATTAVRSGVAYIKISPERPIAAGGEGEQAPWLARPYTLTVTR